jgi:hypothetical protein
VVASQTCTHVAHVLHSARDPAFWPTSKSGPGLRARQQNTQRLSRYRMRSRGASAGRGNPGARAGRSRPPRKHDHHCQDWEYMCGLVWLGRRPLGADCVQIARVTVPCRRRPATPAVGRGSSAEQQPELHVCGAAGRSPGLRGDPAPHGARQGTPRCTVPLTGSARHGQRDLRPKPARPVDCRAAAHRWRGMPGAAAR